MAAPSVTRTSPVIIEHKTEDANITYLCKVSMH